MMRGWIGIALLAGSWLLGISYFAPARPFAWFCAVATASVLLSALPAARPSLLVTWVSSALSLPAAMLMPWPYTAIPILLLAGLWLQRAAVPARWPRRLGSGAVIASGILLIQAITLQIYQSLTARAHELPWPLTEFVGAIARASGIDTAVEGATLTMRDLVDPQRITATWELLFDPASVLFLVGGLVWLACLSSARLLPQTRSGWWRHAAARLIVVWLVWLPLRVALLIALLIHRTLRADLITLPNVGDLLVNSWLHCGLLAGLVVLAARWVACPGAETDDSMPAAESGSGRDVGWTAVALAVALIGGGVAILIGTCFWVPVGTAKSGRILVVERHSTWEPTIEPYGTEIYGEAGSYNYAAIYEYCEQFFDMSRLLEEEPIDEARLRQCDVLVIKTPTSRYSQDEISAIVQFVREGGSLLLIGDHTNVFNMNTCLNDIARHFGFTFRNDLLFCVSSPYDQRYRPPLIRHPALQHVPPMNFAVSCSIDPGRSAGRMVVRNTGLWSLPPAYQESNYHPQAEYRPGMHYGAWCQAWATHFGSGRVLGFADSTLFSNFCTYQPGKAELFVGMLQWLNHRNWPDRPWIWWLLAVPGLLVGSISAAVGIRQSDRLPNRWSLVIGATLAGWAVAALVLIAVADASITWPQVLRPMRHVVIDREISEVPLFTGAFADSKEGLGYGMFEQWIPRLGYCLSRRSGREVVGGDALVVICPTRSPSDDYLDRVQRFVAEGGHLLVVDSPDVEGSTAGSLLESFGLAIHQNTSMFDATPLRVADCEAQPAIQASCEVSGGEPIAWVGDRVVAARIRYERGTVTAIGFGSLFNDAAMGFHWLPLPENATLQRYEVLYAVLRAALPASLRREASSARIRASHVDRSDVPSPEFSGSAGDP